MSPERKLIARSGKPSFISLFSGCGGLDLGFIEAGFEPIAAYDIWPLAVANYKNNLGNHILEYDLSQAKIPYDGECDVVLAGSPCQGFSTVGKRRIDDPRNHLLHAAVKIAIRANPQVIIFENVPGILQGAHKEHWDLACNEIEKSGYKTLCQTIDARDIGIPQTRKRVILIAWKTGLTVLPAIKHRDRKTLKDVIFNACSAKNHEPRILADETPDYIISKRIKPGQKLCNVRGAESSVHTWSIPEVFGETTEKEQEVLIAIMKLRRRKRARDHGDADPVSLASIQEHLNRRVLRDTKSLLKKGYLKRVEDDVDLRHTFNGKYRRACLDGSSFTVDSRFGDPKCFLHPTKPRGFSVREAARIQGFPDSYVFEGSIDDQFKLVANAVPPQMGLAIGEMVKNAFKMGQAHDE